MASVRAMVLRAAGVNCDVETAHAWRLAGAEAEPVHVRRCIENPKLLNDFQIITFPGGFSYGDDISAGRILADQISRNLAEPLHSFVDQGGLVLGVCNGFQVLVKCGLLPFSTPGDWRDVSIVASDPPGYVDRWVWLRAADSPCVFLEPGDMLELPMAHGEGRVVLRDAEVGRRVAQDRHIALRYVIPPDDAPTVHANHNPNGSELDIAGLCDASGRVFGLMPHPERFLHATNHPAWTTRGDAHRPGDGQRIFDRAVAALR